MTNAPATRLRIEDRAGGVLAVVFDRPESRVNLIDEAFVAEMNSALDAVIGRGASALLFVSAKPGQFIAGADVALVARLSSAEDAEAKSRLGQALFDRVERLPFPTVAAISGPCLGGGLELALACSRRVVVNDERAVVGLPEVRLGILPGFGGTVRLPRLLDPFVALDLATTGRSVRPKEAKRLGLVDLVVPQERLEAAAFQLALVAPPRRRALGRRIREALAVANPIGAAVTRALLHARIRRKTGGHYPAPFAIVDRILEGRRLAPQEALRREARAFGALAATPVAKQLLWLFQASEALGRQAPGFVVATDRTRRAAVVGAGTMGGGIAGALAEAGIDVRLKDVAIEPLRQGLAGAAAPLLNRVKKRRLSPRERDAILGRISPTTEPTGFSRLDVVIEAVPEVLDLKIRVLREIEALVPEGAMLATNTSSLPITRIAQGLSSPDRLVGLHFFNPVSRMPLVEVIPGRATREDVVQRAVLLARRLRKSPLVVADSPGFLVNRLLLPYLNEAALAVEDGWSIATIDRALERFGMPMGPLRILDEVGLDVARHVSRVLEEAFGERAKPPGLLDRLVAARALGTKSGRGFWVHEGGKRRPNLADVGVTGRGETPRGEAICDRLLLGMILEAARALAEDVCGPDGLDVGTVLGAGFPPFRGGVRRWAASLGEDEVRRRLDRLAALYGARFAPPAELALLFRAP